MAKSSKPARKFNLAVPIILLLVLVIVGIALIVGGDESKTKQKPRPSTKGQVISTSCGPYRKDGVMTINGHQLNIEIAFDKNAKVKGLAGRPCIEPNWGMLFDFGRDGQYAMWMKDMNFPIDIIWINSNHTVATLEDNVDPSTYHSKNPYFENDAQHPARYILEVKAGQSQELGLDLGTPVQFQKS